MHTHTILYTHTAANKTTAVKTTKSSSDEDSGVRHRFDTILTQLNVSTILQYQTLVFHHIVGMPHENAATLYNTLLY